MKKGHAGHEIQATFFYLLESPKVRPDRQPRVPASRLPGRNLIDWQVAHDIPLKERRRVFTATVTSTLVITNAQDSLKHVPDDKPDYTGLARMKSVLNKYRHTKR